ncbi:probable polygalacturonase At3g15720 [Hibiscus syriacus]|uniref:probable polygalacturonase At3g15720 n=1 Tax=Hibiscus syriacus TaxID=106335 RepID=UPI001923CD8F|nr:probable polygalacturonase At3g15720 [Hibiscus syriacus]
MALWMDVGKAGRTDHANLILVSRDVSSDDCISVGDKTFHINITDIDCGPGHGISIGSLGMGGSEAQVENINVMRVNFQETTDGARIKTWQTGKGIVQGETGVQIKAVSYSGLSGTSKTEVANNLNCINVVPCSGITLDNILLTPATNEISQLTSSCNNAYGERLVFTIFVTVLHILTPGVSSALNSFNVMNYGAVGDGRADDSAAFLKAWKAACKAPSRNPSLIIPARKIFLLKPVTFRGPCKSTSIYILMSGNIVSPNSKMAWKGYHINRWLAFTYVNGLNIVGSGTINGRGHAWWPNPCLHKVPKGVTCKGPTALTFYRCNGLVLKGIKHINSQRNHITISNCNDVTVSNLHISAPRTSPNTDGIDISGSTNVWIRNSFIGTGDDCVAISAGSSRINITGIACGPGHGISIGSLGAGENEKVEEVQVRNCTFKGTMTGVRIKTWQGSVGYARKITFDKIRFIRADSPIIIDQYYCPDRVNCKNETMGIKISDVTYSSITGTSITDKVINLSCDHNVGCTNIHFRNVYIKSTVPGKKAYSFAFNAHGNYTHTRPVVTGLLPEPGHKMAS